MITTKNTGLMMIGSFLLVAIALFFPVDAFAAGGVDVTQQTKQLSTQLVNVPKLIAMGAYVIGAFFAIRALFALKGFIESPDDNPITKVMGFAAVGALLIVLPYIISVATTSIGAKNENITGSSAFFNDAGF